MLTLDGCDISGNLWQGSLQCVISMPSSVEIDKYEDGDSCAILPELFGECKFELYEVAQMIKSGKVKGGRVYYWHVVE